MRAGGRKQTACTDTYVQNKASRTETREIVLSTPAGKKTLGACHALQSARIAPRPTPMCPAGLPVSVYLLFCLKVLVQREKLAKVRKFDKYTYTYGLPRVEEEWKRSSNGWYEVPIEVLRPIGKGTMVEEVHLAVSRLVRDSRGLYG